MNLRRGLSELNFQQKYHYQRIPQGRKQTIGRKSEQKRKLKFEVKRKLIFTIRNSRNKKKKTSDD